MPHFINDPDTCVLEAIEGLCMERHATIKHLGATAPYNAPNVIALREELISKDKVAVICGGGSGHEPMHGGFVSPSMLSAAVCGRVFASPPISHVRAAIDYLIANGAPSVLVLVKRYTGDIINFGAAVESAAVQYGPARVAMAVIGDDVAFGAEDPDARGIAGTVLWYKLITAFGATTTATCPTIRSATCTRTSTCLSGKHTAALPPPAFPSLAQLKAFADVSARHIRSIGASAQSCTLPATTAPNAAIPPGEVEVGLGIHGERGSQSIPMPTADALVRRMLLQLLRPVGKGVAAAGDEPKEREKEGEASAEAQANTNDNNNTCSDGRSWLLPSSPTNEEGQGVCGGERDQLLVYLNNLGSTTNLEMSVLVKSTLRALWGGDAAAHVGEGGASPFPPLSVALCGSGALCTSLDMHGFSITLVNLTRLTEALTHVYACTCAEEEGGDGDRAATDVRVRVPDVAQLFLSGDSLGIYAAPSAEKAEKGIFMKRSEVDTDKDGGGEAAATIAHQQQHLDARGTAIKAAFAAAVRLWAEKAALYNSLDAACGDGDTGSGIASAAHALLAHDARLLGQLASALAPLFSSSPSSSVDAAEGEKAATPTCRLRSALLDVSRCVCDAMAGSMGALLSIFIAAMADGCDGCGWGVSTSATTTRFPRAGVVAAMLTKGAAAVERVIGTVPGDRTFIDVTAAVASALKKEEKEEEEEGAGLLVAIQTAVRDSTAAVSKMRARKGRARYLGGKEVGTRDPGAEIVGDFIVSVVEALL